eukprot:2553877-Rhodomonas_salina.1
MPSRSGCQFQATRSTRAGGTHTVEGRDHEAIILMLLKSGGLGAPCASSVPHMAHGAREEKVYPGACSFSDSPGTTCTCQCQRSQRLAWHHMQMSVPEIPEPMRTIIGDRLLMRALNRNSSFQQTPFPPVLSTLLAGVGSFKGFRSDLC